MTDTDKSTQPVVAAFADAWNRHDMAAFGELFAADAEFVNVVGLWWKGRDEIRKAHEFTHAGMFRNSRLEILETRLRQPSPEVAIVRSAWQLEGHTGANDEPLPMRQGLLLLVLAKDQDSGWKIIDAQNTDVIEGTLTRPQNA